MNIIRLLRENRRWTFLVEGINGGVLEPPQVGTRTRQAAVDLALEHVPAGQRCRLIVCGLTDSLVAYGRNVGEFVNGA